MLADFQSTDPLVADPVTYGLFVRNSIYSISTVGQSNPRVETLGDFVTHPVIDRIYVGIGADRQEVVDEVTKKVREILGDPTETDEPKSGSRMISISFPDFVEGNF